MYTTSVVNLLDLCPQKQKQFSPAPSVMLNTKNGLGDASNAARGVRS